MGRDHQIHIEAKILDRANIDAGITVLAIIGQPVNERVNFSPFYYHLSFEVLLYCGLSTVSMEMLSYFSMTPTKLS